MALEISFIRPIVDPRATARIEKLRERLKGLPPGTNMPELSTLDGFAEWLNHPVTLEILARVENKREKLRDELETMKPCPSCRKDGEHVDKEHRAWTAGFADALDAVAISIMSSQSPTCEHASAPAPAPAGGATEDAANAAAQARLSLGDAGELAWWRSQFGTRFPEGELPKPGTALVGRRFHMVDESDPLGAEFGCRHVKSMATDDVGTDE